MFELEIPMKRNDESWENYCHRLIAMINLADIEIHHYRSLIPTLEKVNYLIVSTVGTSKELMRK